MVQIARVFCFAFQLHSLDNLGNPCSLKWDSETLVFQFCITGMTAEAPSAKFQNKRDVGDGF